MAVEVESELTFSDYVVIAKRRKLQIAAASFVVLTAIVIAVLTKSPVYKASGFIAVESPIISKALIGDSAAIATATRYVDEHLDKVKEKIFSRENLVKVNNKYKLYPGLTKPSLVAVALGDNIKLVPKQKSADGNEWGGQVLVGFSIVTKTNDAEKTYKLANDVVTQLLDLNTKDRTQRAAETTTFLTNELNSLKNELTIIEDKIAAYKLKHANSLPEHETLHIGTLEELKTALKELDVEYKGTKEELRYLDVELTKVNATINSSNNPNTRVASELDKARAELDRALVLYKETHPTIRALKRKVAILESTPSKPKNETKKINLATELAISKINSQIEAANARLAGVAEEKRFTKARMAKLKGQIINIPQVERGLAGLLRDYENIKEKYDAVESKQVSAKIAESLELENKSERLVLKESPEYPRYKEGLGKSKMILLGMPISIVLGFGFALLLELLDKKIRRQSVLVALINTTPIAVIPYIETPMELAREKQLIRMGYLLITALVCILVILAVIHYLITPLGELLLPMRALLG